MSAADWEDLKEEICAELLLGKENGEAEPETMGRILWLERERYLTLPISERLQQFFKAALEAVEKPVNPPVGGERGADSDKSKLLKWKTRSRSLGAPPTSQALRKGRLHPSHAGRAVGLVAIKREEHPRRRRRIFGAGPPKDAAICKTTGGNELGGSAFQAEASPN
jgi:hypothetical protein